MKKLVLFTLFGLSLAPALQAAEDEDARCISTLPGGNNIQASTPALRFTAPDGSDLTASDAFVKDTATGLIWSRCPVGFSYDDFSGTCNESDASSGDFTWKAALQEALDANTAQLDGASNWRLPNIKELGSIIERKCARPALNYLVFPGMQEMIADVWSNTPASSAAATTPSVWVIDFEFGLSDKITPDSQTTALLRLVREAP